MDTIMNIFKKLFTSKDERVFFIKLPDNQLVNVYNIVAIRKAAAQKASGVYLQPIPARVIVDYKFGNNSTNSIILMCKSDADVEALIQNIYNQIRKLNLTSDMLTPGKGILINT